MFGGSMNKKSLLVIAFIILITGSVVFALTNKKADAPSTQSQAQVDTQRTVNTTSETVQTVPKSKSAYIDYSQESLASAEGQRVLFFHAPWCSQCRALESDIKEQGVPEGFTILKVDYDSSKDLRQKYGVTLQTSLVKIDANGDKSGDVFVAYNEPTLSAVIRDFLN